MPPPRAAGCRQTVDRWMDHRLTGLLIDVISMILNGDYTRVFFQQTAVSVANSYGLILARLPEATRRRSNARARDVEIITLLGSHFAYFRFNREEKNILCFIADILLFL